MDNSIKNLNQTSNLIDITQDITNRITDDYLVSSERNNIIIKDIEIKKITFFYFFFL